MTIANTGGNTKNLLSNGDITASSYGIEFFHIYTDESISPVQEASRQYLDEALKAWDFPYSLIVLIDNYNPEISVLNVNDVLGYLREQGMKPDFWAYEADLLQNAERLLVGLTSGKLKNNYLRYIAQHKKYPCSLLTATWYLTRLGALPEEGIIHSTNSNLYIPHQRLLNILPQDYKTVEQRAFELIAHSTYKGYLDQIQDLFYPALPGRSVTLW